MAQPALVLCPRDDLWDETHANVSQLADAHLVVFAEAGNGFLDLDTDRVAKVIGEFLG